MHGKKSFLALSTAFAALFVGCEWTGSSDSDSWSSAYDAMNFSGTYRAVTTATAVEDTTTTTTTTDDTAFTTLEESGGTFAAGRKTASGRTSKGNVVPGSVQISAGDYVWNDNGSGGLVFGGGSAGGSSGGESSEQPGTKNLGKTSTTKLSYNGTLMPNLVPGSVTIKIGGSTAFEDDNNKNLVGKGVNGTGSVNYNNGTVQISFLTAPPANADIVAEFKYTVKDGEAVVVAGQSGTGAILYSSGSWSLELNPAIKEAKTISVRYSYYLKNSAATGTTTIKTSTGTEVSSLTIGQNGQNLTITLNNGIVMSGKFTNVQQTGKVNQDTNAGYNTYNAQFQVQTTDNKFVGSLNYDLQNGYRMLNGTWTWGKSSYDVQAVGPAWLNSADQSTLSPGVITK